MGWGSASVDYCGEYWQAVGLLLLFYLLELALKLRVLQLFLLALSVLEVLVRPFVLFTSECKQEWTFCSALHRNS